MINHNIMNIILDKMALKEWEEKKKRMNEEYKKQYKVICKKNGNFKCVKSICKFCSYMYHYGFVYNYRDLNYNYIDKFIYISKKTVCDKCHKYGMIVSDYQLSKNYQVFDLQQNL